ncbi:MAG: hypothetical protein Q8L46_01225, partial [candidate division WWE3 bacterium]|nr:hypothetical protein [candidate division WWE3 bacterium]
MGVCINNRCVPEGVVAVTADKTKYKQGETVRVTVRNGLDRSVWYFGGCGSPQFWSLSKLEDNGWKGVDFFLPDLAEGREVCSVKLCERQEPWELKSGSTVEHDWRGSICEWPSEPTTGIPKIEPELIEEGTYRISFTYGLSKDEEGFGLLEERTVYSEF